MMPIDIAVLTTTIVTSFLLPYAKIGLEKIAEGAGKKVGEKSGEYASELTGKIWNRIQSVFASSEDRHTLALFEKNPNEMAAMLNKSLQQKLEEDPNLARSLAEMIDAPGPDGHSSGAQIMNAGLAGILDMRGADLSQANNMTLGGVVIGQNPTPATGSGDRLDSSPDNE